MHISLLKELSVKVLIVLLMLIGAFPLVSKEIVKLFDEFFISGLPSLLLSGLISGMYYAINDSENRIWIETSDQNTPCPIQHYVHIYWVHILSGMFASGFLFLLIECLQKDIKDFFIIDISLTALVLLGYTGLLPRTLWALANRGNPFKGS